MVKFQHASVRALLHLSLIFRETLPNHRHEGTCTLSFSVRMSQVSSVDARVYAADILASTEVRDYNTHTDSAEAKTTQQDDTDHRAMLHEEPSQGGVI